MPAINESLFSNKFMQLSYMTNDLDRAMKEFRDLYGFKGYLELRDVDLEWKPGHTAHLNAALAYVGDLQIEIMQPSGGDDSLYRECLKEGDHYQIVLHHEAHEVPTSEQFTELRDAVRAKGYPIVLDLEDDFCRYIYVDTRPMFGHYLEFEWYTPDHGQTLLEAIRCATDGIPGPALPGTTADAMSIGSTR